MNEKYNYMKDITGIHYHSDKAKLHLTKCKFTSEMLKNIYCIEKGKDALSWKL